MTYVLTEQDALALLVSTEKGRALILQAAETLKLLPRVLEQVDVEMIGRWGTAIVQSANFDFILVRDERGALRRCEVRDVNKTWRRKPGRIEP